MTRILRYLSANLPAIHWKKEVPLLGLFLAVAVAFQWLGGAYRSEFGGHPDEPAHYVTGLMIRDYLASGFHSGPMTYATEYYDHYPKVALGNWPPVFYLIQAAWTLPFSPHRCSVLLLMAVLSALTAWVLFRALQRELWWNAGLFGSLLFLALPLARAHTGMVMTEIPVTLLAFTAVLFFARFLEQERTLDSLLFGLFASLAILTKGSGLFLALVVPLAVALTRKFDLLRRPAFWYPAVVVVILCGPWTWKFREVARAGWMEDNPSWHFTRLAVMYYPQKLVLAVGILLAILTLLGLVSQLFRSRNGKAVTSLWASAGALLVSVPIFHSTVPAGLEPRHLIPALPAVVMFSLAGALEVVATLKSRGLTTQLATAVTIGVLVLGFAGETYRPSPKGYAGLGPVAGTLLDDPANAKAVFLISSDATGEGIFISEVAMRERRPGHVVRRASKVLASSSWSGSGYQARFASEEELIKFLGQEPIEVLVLDESIPATKRVAHHDLLRQTVEHHPARFTRLQSHGMMRAGVEQPSAIHVYRFKPRPS